MSDTYEILEKIAASGNLPIIEKTVAVVTENLSERVAALEAAAVPEQSTTFYAVSKSDDDCIANGVSELGQLAQIAS